MTYREPAPRPLRLWYVSLTFGKPSGISAVEISALASWVWGREQSEAVEAAIIAAKKEGHDVPDQYSAEAICGEDFADLEAKGPPKAAT